MVDSTYSFWWATISIRLSRHGVSRSKFAFRQNFLLIKYLIGFDDFDVIRCPPVTLRIHRPKAPLDIAIVSSVNELIIYLLSLDSIKLEISINPVPVFSNVISAGEKAILLNLVDTYPQVFTPVHAPKILLRTLKMAADTRGIYNGRCITLSERWSFPRESSPNIIASFSFSHSPSSFPFLLPWKPSAPTISSIPISTQTQSWGPCSVTWTRNVRTPLSPSSSKLSAISGAEPDITWDAYLAIVQRAWLSPAAQAENDPVVKYMCRQWLCSDEDEDRIGFVEMFRSDWWANWRF